MSIWGNRFGGVRLRTLALVLVFSAFWAFYGKAFSADDPGKVAEELGKNSALAGLNLRVGAAEGNGFSGTLGRSNIQVSIFKVDNKWNIALLAPNVSFAKFSSSLANTPLGDMAFENVGLVVTLSDTSFKAGAVPNANIKASLGQVFGAEEKIEWKSGVNFFGQVKTTDSGAWGEFKKELGVTGGAVTILGRVGASFLAKFANGESEDGSGDTTEFDLSVKFPALAPPCIPSAIRFTGSSLDFKAVKEGTNKTITISLNSSNQLTIRNKTFNFESCLSFTKETGNSWKKSFASTMVKENSWKNAGGLDFIDLKEISFYGETSKVSSSTLLLMGLRTKATIKGGPTFEVAGEFTMYKGAIDDFTLRMPSTLKFSDIPGVKEIPGISELGVKDVWASMNGFGGTLVWTKKNLETSFMMYIPRGKTGDIAFLLKFPQLDMKKLIPKLALPLVFPQAYLVLAKGGFDSKLSDLPVNLQEFLADISTTPTFQIHILKGINLIAVFNPGDTSGSVKTAMEKAGITDPMIIAGSIEGIFGGGTPAFALAAKLPNFNFPARLPFHGAIRPQGIGTEFFLKMTSSLDLSLGMAIRFLFSVSGNDLTLVGQFSADVSATGVGLGVTGKLEGEWKDIFGLPGITVRDLVFGFSLDAEGAVGVKAAGSAKFGSKDYGLAFGTKLEPAALGFPKEVLLDFTASQMSTIPLLNTIEIAEIVFRAIAQKAADKQSFLNTIKDANKRKKAQEVLEKLASPENSIFKLLHLDKLPIFQLKDFHVKLVTPGATDPDLKVQGPGAGLKGTLILLKKEIAKVDSFLDMSGLKIYGEFLLKDFGPLLKIEEAKIDIAANFSEMPHFYICFKASILGLKPTIKITISIDGVQIEFGLKAGDLFQADFVGKTKEADLLNPKDFQITAKLKGDFQKWFTKEIANRIKNWEPDQEFLDALKELEDAKKEVENLKKEIDKQRLIVLRDREKVLQSAEKAREKVEEIEKKIEEKKKKLKDTPKWRIFKRAKYALEIAGLYIAKECAELYAKAVEECVDSIPVDADPRVWGVITAYKTALAGLHAAEEIVEAGQEVTDGIKAIAEKMANGIAGLDVFAIEDSELSGSFKSLIGKRPIHIYVKVRIMGEPFEWEGDFSWSDMVNSIKALFKNKSEQLRNLLATKVGKKSKLLSKQMSQLDACQANFADIKEKLAPEFQATMRARPFAKKTFFLVNSYSRLFLTGEGGKTTAGTKAMLSSGKDAKGTPWKLELTSDGFFRLFPGSGKQALALTGGATGAGTKLVLSVPNDTGECEWMLENQGNSFRLKNRKSQTYLTLPSSGSSNLWKNLFAGYQAEIQPLFRAQGLPGGTLPSLGFRAMSGVTEVLATVKKNLESMMSQQWDLVETGDLSVGYIKHNKEGSFLTMSQDSNSVVVAAKAANPDPTQLWEIVPADPDPLSPYVFVRLLANGKYLHTAPLTEMMKTTSPIAIVERDLESLAKSTAPAFTFYDPTKSKQFMLRKVYITANTFALVSVTTGNALVVVKGTLAQIPFPSDANATTHVWTLINK